VPPSVASAPNSPAPPFSPRPSPEGRGFRIVVENANRSAVRRRWEELCRSRAREAPPEFNEVYANLALFEDDPVTQNPTFIFHRGDPQRMRRALERILEGYAGIGAVMHVLEGEETLAPRT